MDGLFPEMSPLLPPHRSSEKNQLRWGRHRLETDVCVAGHQSADPEAIQNYVKKVRNGMKLKNRCVRLTPRQVGNGAGGVHREPSADLAHKLLSAA